MDPTQSYQQDLKAGKILPDPLQALATRQLQRIYDDLMHNRKRRKLQLLGRRRRQVKGLYLWGSVGVGKTYLMDLFYKSLPTERKLRTHFHNFMRKVHNDLKRLQGKKDPLRIVAREFHMHCDVLCFDEFFVEDIADAMLLGGLFTELFALGICLIATSNTPPKKLYLKGLQRQQFLPTIALIQQKTEVLHLNSNNDYRLRKLTEAGVYFTPLDQKAETMMADCFAMYADEDATQQASITVEDRVLQTIRCARHVVWFDFNAICNIPRSQNDYLTLVKQFRTILISNVPQIGEREDDKVTYFIHLIDILYDTNTQLLLSAEVPIDALYTKGRKLQAFERTKSRLQEMQSKEYLAQVELK